MVKKVIIFWAGKLLHFALITLLLFALILLHFALVLHFAAIVITFCVSITFCGDYYILRRNIILLEGRVTVSNNLTKRRQNGSKIGTRDKFATHLR